MRSYSSSSTVAVSSPCSPETITVSETVAPTATSVADTCDAIVGASDRVKMLTTGTVATTSLTIPTRTAACRVCPGVARVSMMS